MDEPPAGQARIVVVARPTLGRAIATTLRAAGYEVHRTPGDADLDGLVARLQAHLAIVALDLPWLNAIDAVSPLIDRRRPVLLLGDAGGDSRVEGVPRLPLLLNAALLLEAVSSLLVSSDP